MTATVIDFRAAVERRHLAEMAARAIRASAPTRLALEDRVLILPSGHTGTVRGIYGDGRALIKLDGEPASTFVPLSQLVVDDGPGGAA